MKSQDGPLNALSAVELAKGFAAGAFSPLDVVEDCLGRIDARDAELGAWAFVDADLARAQARDLMKRAGRGPLYGIPVGIKDVFDTFDMPTEMGSPIYVGHRPSNDAAAVAALRAAGAVILGKTVTCEFAGMSPGKTVNPHDPARTPGGSSSGSAAAVADLMVPVALGTQTGGSVIRPSSFCGIVGFKPSFGTIDRAGLKMAAESLDTIGMHARTVEDVELLYDVFTGGVPASAPLPATPRFGLCRTFLWDTAGPDTVAAVEAAAAGLADAGAGMDEVTLPDDFAGLGRARTVINAVERARAMAFEWNRHRADISADLGTTLEEGYATPFETYVEALDLALRLRRRLDEVFGDCDALLAPAVPGAAPEGLSFTGDPALQGLWTILHVPTITLPTYKTYSGLPVGIQLVGRSRGDKPLLAAARWALARLAGE